MSSHEESSQQALMEESLAMLLTRRELLGTILIRRGTITEAQLALALEAQSQSEKRAPLGEILIEKGLLSQSEIAQALAEQLGLEFCDLGLLEISSSTIVALSPRLAERFQAIPTEYANGRLTLAIANPFDLAKQDLLRELLAIPLRFVVATEAALEEAMQRYYRGTGETVEGVLEGLDESDFLILRGEEGVADLAALESIANEAPIIRLVNLLLSNAVKAGATDIHLEPFEDEVKVRCRVDGVLYEVEAPPKRLFPAVLSRIKLMAGMDITEKRLPQDGRIRMRMAERDLDFRVAVAPTLHGESAVLRILNRQTMYLTYEELGLANQTLVRFSRLVEHPHGMILVTGPTGSGKTTTL